MSVMDDDRSQSRVPSTSRQRQDSTTNRSPPSLSTNPDRDRDSRPAKRSRKAINCEPCRASKLKCDRARPCSSCVLRGTASACYQDSRDDPREENYANRIDPHHEIARMRQSLATLEAHLLRAGPPPPPPATTSTIGRSDSTPPIPIAKQEPDVDVLPEKSVPGMLARQGQGGLYRGPTAAATHLLSFKSANDPRDSDESAERNSGDDQVHSEYSPEVQRGYDEDLLTHLPALHIIDGLVDYYFEYCNWIYRHVNQHAFMAAWNRFKSGASADRLVLSTLCVIMALAIRYLPSSHSLLSSLPQTHEELAQRYYDLAREALNRYKAESKALSLELIEVLLIRTHYLTLSKNEAEEIWAIRGELISNATAMGLHRDPEKWRMPRDLAERRRWAWWHIILLERWQAFLFGRPLSVASHHFDTLMPSYVDPAVDPTGRIYLPNLHLFRLAHILGDVVDDAVSVRPVPYERVQDRDRALVSWMENLPLELDLDDYRLARSLASRIPSEMRLGVQSVIIRTSYYHIRFTLHRPYAAAAHTHTTPGKTGANSAEMDARMAQSLDTAVSAADKLIQLVGQARPDFLLNSSLAAPGHVHWGPFHCFSAAMFFSFQLISNPDQPGANLFRGNVRRVLDILALQRGVGIADKATDILLALAPLYEVPSADGQHADSAAEREKKKRNVLALVRTLAFPYHDSPTHPRSSIDSPSGARRMMESPGNNPTSPPVLQHHGGTPVSPSGVVPSQQQQMQHGQQQQQQSPVGPRGPGHAHMQSGAPMYSHPPPPPPMASMQQMNVHGQSMHHPPPTHPHPSTSPNLNIYTPSYPQQQQQQPQQHPQQQQHQQHQHQQHTQHPQHSTNYALQPGPVYGESSRATAIPHPSAEETMWGASVGFGQGEWMRFLDVVQKPDFSRV